MTQKPRTDDLREIKSLPPPKKKARPGIYALEAPCLRLRGSSRLGNRTVGSLSKGVFERHTSTGSEALSFLYAWTLPNLYCQVSFFLKRRFTREFQPNHSPMLQKVHFRLTSVVQKRCCLSSLVFILDPHR